MNRKGASEVLLRKCHFFGHPFHVGRLIGVRQRDSSDTRQIDNREIDDIVRIDGHCDGIVDNVLSFSCHLIG